MNPYINKFLIAIVTVMVELSIVLSASPSQPVTAPEWLLLGVAFFGALGVYAIPNSPARH